MSKPVGLDIDGVLADFNTAYTRVIYEHTGLQCRKYDRATYPTVWQWEREAGLSKELEDEVWEEKILKSNDFWAEIPPYPWAQAALQRLDESVRPSYFITSRSGKNCKIQTESWMRTTLDDYMCPTVCVVPSHKNKIDVLRGLDIGFYIDDRVDTIQLIAEVLPKVNLYIFDQPWNRVEGLRATRIVDIQQFLDDAGI